MDVATISSYLPNREKMIEKGEGVLFGRAVEAADKFAKDPIVIKTYLEFEFHNMIRVFLSCSDVLEI